MSLKNLLLSPRFTSFYWRTGVMAALGLLDLLSSALSSGQIALPAWAIVTLGLLLNEVTKALNNQSQGLPAGFVKN